MQNLGVLTALPSHRFDTVTLHFFRFQKLDKLPIVRRKSLEVLDEVFNRCSEQIAIFREAFQKEYFSDDGNLTGYLDEDGDFSKESFSTFLCKIVCSEFSKRTSSRYLKPMGNK